MTETTRERPALLAGFAERGKTLAGSGPEWLRGQRRRALQRFEELGFPTPRLEEWKNTSVQRIAGTAWRPAPAGLPEPGRLAALGLDGLGPHRLVLVDGRYAAGLSATAALPAGVRAGSLSRALEACPEALEPFLTRLAAFEDRPFTALNTALFEDGAAIEIGPGVRLDEPLVVLHVSSAASPRTAAHPRTLVVAGADSEAAVVECFVALGDAPYFNNAVTELFAGPAARLHHYRLQDEAGAAFHVGTLELRQERDSRVTAHNFDLGASLARLDTAARLDGEGAECVLNGLYATRGSQHVDNHSVLDHARPHCQSRELYKGILMGDSRAVFNGRIVVRPGAQKTDAKQSNPNLLLSDRALVHTRPQLEIYADDVKCTHGATIGHLDPDMQFYLRSRGLGVQEARRLLIHGFAREVLDRVGIPALQQRLERELVRRLDGEAHD